MTTADARITWSDGKFAMTNNFEIYDLYNDIGYIVTILKSHSSPDLGIYINGRGMEQIVVNFVTAREKYGK